MNRKSFLLPLPLYYTTLHYTNTPDVYHASLCEQLNHPFHPSPHPRSTALYYLSPQDAFCAAVAGQLGVDPKDVQVTDVVVDDHGAVTMSYQVVGKSSDNDSAR